MRTITPPLSGRRITKLTHRSFTTLMRLLFDSFVVEVEEIENESPQTVLRMLYLRCVKALHGHFREEFSIIHQSDEFGCFWVKIGSFIRNMTSSGLFTKKMTTFEPKFSSQHLVKHGL